jgi:hypothetical protein
MVTEVPEPGNEKDSSPESVGVPTVTASGTAGEWTQSQRF